VGDLSLEELGDRFISGMDVILTEGFKKNSHPKIEVYRKALGRDFISRGDTSLLAVAGDRPEGIDAPCYDLDDIAGLANLIEKKVLRA
jgi:molybdopterin-guanine dinucleotide biosynthesis protein B